MGVVGNVRTVLAIVGLVKTVMSNKEMLAALRVLLDQLEVIADALPGDFPDAQIDMLQGIIGEGPEEE